MADEKERAAKNSGAIAFIRYLQTDKKDRKNERRKEGEFQDSTKKKQFLGTPKRVRTDLVAPYTKRANWLKQLHYISI